MTSARNLTDVLRPTAALLRAQLAVAAAIEQRAVAATDLDGTTTDLLLRIALSPDGRLRGVHLCRQLHLSPSYVSRRIDRAVAEGLVERRPDPDDRRAQIITLTEAGQEALDDFTPRLVDVVDEVMFNTFDTDEVDTLIGLLSRLEVAATTALEPNASTTREIPRPT